MLFKFDTRKALNVILFILKSLGGKSEPFRLFAILYAADLKHLARFDSLILDDYYVAMKNGAIPFNVYCMYQQLSHGTEDHDFPVNIKEYFYSNEQNLIVSIAQYDDNYISHSEAACLFDAIRENKNQSYDALVRASKNAAWREAGKNGEISLLSMAKESGASDELLNYISQSMDRAPAIGEDNTFAE